MGCGTSKDTKNGLQTNLNANHSQVKTHSSGPMSQAPPQSVNAWDHPTPMKSPYPQGKPEEVLNRMRDADLVMNDNVPIYQELVDNEMVGKVVKESYAIKEGYAYTRLDN